MSEEIVRTCPYCAEQIRVAAKVCPHCRQWLTILSLRNPATFLAVFYFCALALIVGFLVFLGRLLNPGINFMPYRDGISIVDSRMNIQDAGKDSSVHVVAVITNQTDIAWKQVQLDVRFFDQSGKLIDGRMYIDSSVILPHGESAFRVNTRPSHSLADYDSYKIFVRYARDARAHF